jgi:hypothetical protein
MATRQQLIDASIADVFGGDPAQFDVKTDLRIWSQDGKASGYLDATNKWHWLIYNDSTTLGGPNPQPNYMAVLTSPPIYVGTGPAAVAALSFVVDQYVPAMTVVHWEARWGTDIQMKVVTPYVNAVVPGSSGPYVVDSLTCPNVLVNWTSTDPTNLKISCVNAQGQPQPAGTPLSAQTIGLAHGIAGSAVAQPMSGSTGGTSGGGGSGSGPPQTGQVQRMYTPIAYNSYPPRTNSAYNALRKMGIDHVSGRMYSTGDTYWQWQEWIQGGSIPSQKPPEDGLWYTPADIDAFNPDSRQAVYVDEYNGAFFDSLFNKDFAKMAYANDNDTLYATLPTGSVPGRTQFSVLVAINILTATVTDRGNITNPNMSIPSLQMTIIDLVYDYHNNRMLIVVWEQYTKTTDYYTLNGAQVSAQLQPRAVFRNAIHVLNRLAGVNPIQRLWTSKEVVMPDSPNTLIDAGYYKFVSVAMSSQNGRMYASAMKPFAETDTTKPERWLIKLDVNAGDGSDVEIAKISDDSINSICYNPLNNRLYGNLFNSFATAEIDKSDAQFDTPTIPPPLPPSAGGTGGGTSGGGTGGGGAPAGVLMLDPPTATIANAIENTSYSQNLVAVNGVGPYSWSVIAGSLPPGFTLGGSTTLTEVLSATAPLTPGTYTFTIQVQDSLGAKAHVPYTLVVAPATGLAGFPRQPGALIVDVLGTGAVNHEAYSRFNGINQNVWSAYDFLVITMVSSRAGQLVEIGYGDIGQQSLLSIVQASRAATVQPTSQQQTITQAKLSLAQPTGRFGLKSGIARQPVYNRLLVNFQTANQPQDVLIPIDASRFPAGSSLSYIGFKVVDASQPFAFGVTRIELQKTLGTTAQGFLTQTEQLLKNFGLAAPFSVDDYRALGKFIQYRVVLTSQVPPISPTIIGQTVHEINPAAVYNHPLSRLRGGRRRTNYASDQTIGLENVDYTQTPISIPGGHVQDGFGLEPSKEPVYDPELFFGFGGIEVVISPPLP